MAQAYDPGLMNLAEQYGFRYVQAAVGGCPIGVRLLATGGDGEQHKPSNFKCFEALPNIYAEVLEHWDPQLIIATSWNETNQHVTDGEVVPRGTPEQRAQTRTALEAAVDTLTSNGAQVMFLSVLPPGPSVDCLDQSPPNEDTCVVPVDDARPEAAVNDMFVDLGNERDDVGVIDFTDDVCPNDKCPLTVNGVVVRYDGMHFTGTQSRLMAPLLDDRLRALGIDLAAI